MKKKLYIILIIYILILFNACGNENNNREKSNNYIIIFMKLNQKYEVNPNDIYIPRKENTELEIEYQLLLDKKFIKISTGEAILKKIKN